MLKSERISTDSRARLGIAYAGLILVQSGSPRGLGGHRPRPPLLETARRESTRKRPPPSLPRTGVATIASTPRSGRSGRSANVRSSTTRQAPMGRSASFAKVAVRPIPDGRAEFRITGHGDSWVRGATSETRRGRHGRQPPSSLWRPRTATNWARPATVNYAISISSDHWHRAA